MKYSQNNEEKEIANYFRVCRWANMERPTFLDLGANDGITLSNTYALFLKGWVGTLVEASPKAFKRLKENYFSGGMHAIDLINMAVGIESGAVVLNESGALLGTGDTSLVSTINPEEMDRFKKVVNYEPVPVQCISFPDLLKISNYKTFDFISIDIEGSDLDVLQQMDLDELECLCLCIEWNGKEELANAYGAHVAKFDKFGLFNVIHKNGENIIYGRQ